MSKKVINFTKIRYYMFALSLLLIIGGIAGIIALGGFNLGIDFQPGLSQRVQIADEGMSLTYSGNDDVTFDVVAGNIVVTSRNVNGVVTETFSKEAYSTMGALAEGLNTRTAIEAELITGAQTPVTAVVTGLSLPYEITEAPVYLNVANTESAGYLMIDDVRTALSSMDIAQVQVVGDEMAQEFQIRVGAETEGEKDKLESTISQLLRDTFGSHSVVVKGSDYVGPKFSAALSTSAFLVVVVALLLILAYIWFRFKLAYALSALSALVHDVLIMLGFIAIFRLEVSTTTIAAVLTIIGYSLNDTIVVFDRIRENMVSIKGKTFEHVINKSITQSLSRTLITSLTTLLAVIPLYIFATGAIKLFALNLIFGIVVGTYSSIFIASPVLMGLMKRLKAKNDKHLGRTGEEPAVEAVTPEAAPAAKELEDVEVAVAERKKRGKRQTKK
ncbi:MAG: protein translocase subunit SecF [Spirochaetia bacterium]|nr:protein translocase subunit SecF [Spirochaetia bacterium]MCF7941235.1 protein translocase subunit SecF [Spirochaetia bacterium]